MQVQVLLSAPFFLTKLSKQVLLTQNQPEIMAEAKFPKRIRHKGQTVTIYARSKASPSSRVAWHVAGLRKMERFATYSAAKQRADKLVKDLAQGSHVTALSAKHATGALAALERLQLLFQSTGKSVSLLRSVSEYADAIAKLKGRTLADRLLINIAPVTASEAVEKFIEIDEPRTRALNGERPELSSRYTYNRAIMLRRFATALPGQNVCDLTKEHLDAFIAAKPTETIIELRLCSLKWCSKKI